MKTFIKHNQELGRTEAITFDGQPRFTTPVELVKGKQVVATKSFAAFPNGTFPRTFTLNFYPKGTASVECVDGGIHTKEVFSTKAAASREYEASVARYAADARWTAL